MNIKNKIKSGLNRIVENIIGQEGIDKNVSKLKLDVKKLKQQRLEINQKIKYLNKQIKMWEEEISPNQTSMF